LTHSADSDSESDNDVDPQANNDDSDWNLTIKGLPFSPIVENTITDPSEESLGTVQVLTASLDLNRNDQKIQPVMIQHQGGINSNISVGAKAPNGHTQSSRSKASSKVEDIKLSKKSVPTSLQAREKSIPKKEKNLHQQHRSSLDISSRSELNHVSDKLLFHFDC